MNENRSWFLELLTVVLLIAAVVAGVVLLTCLVRHPCGVDLCAYSVADWVWVMLQFSFAGAFGGFLTFLAQYRFQGGWDPPMDTGLDSAGEPESPNSTNQIDIPMAIFVSCMGGVGAAFAVLFFMAYSEKMNELKTDSPTILKNIVTGVIAGFLGFPLLRRISESAESIIGKAKHAGEKAGHEAGKLEARKATKVAELVKEDVEKASLDNAINLGLQAFRAWQSKKTKKNEFPEYEPPEYKEAKSRLEQIRRTALGNRMAAVIFANLHYMKRQFDQAADIVTATIDEIKRRRTPENKTLSDEHIGDLLFNRACYCSRIAASLQEPARKESKDKMLADLRESFGLTRYNVAAAKDDPDFAAFKTDTDFKRLIAEFEPK